MSEKLQAARTALSWMESEMHSLNRNEGLRHQLSSDVREILNDHDQLEARVAMLEDFVAGAQLDALRALGPDYVPKEVEQAMKSLLERCKTITCESDPDDIEPTAFIKRKQAEPCVPQSAEFARQTDLQRIDDTQRLHTDDIAVDRFAEAMKKKLSEKRDQGYGGWNDKDLCPDGRLQKYLGAHLGKGDPVDIGNFAMMIWNRGESLGE
jgi:hypothetical protein